MNYPAVYRTEMTGEQLKIMLEDVCDNLLTPTLIISRGDMVRVGLSYECAPKEVMGNRIQNMVFSSTGAPVESDKSYAVGGWASVNPDTEGPAIYDLLENYILRESLIAPSGASTVTVKGM